VGRPAAFVSPGRPSMAPQPAPCSEHHGSDQHDANQGPGAEEQDPNDDVVGEHRRLPVHPARLPPALVSPSGCSVRRRAWGPLLCSILLTRKGFGKSASTSHHRHPAGPPAPRNQPQANPGTTQPHPPPETHSISHVGTRGPSTSTLPHSGQVGSVAGTAWGRFTSKSCPQCWHLCFSIGTVHSRGLLSCCLRRNRTPTCFDPPYSGKIPR
jgi:hypothetical protein